MEQSECVSLVQIFFLSFGGFHLGITTKKKIRSVSTIELMRFRHKTFTAQQYLPSIGHLLSREIPLMCLCLQDFMQCKAGGPSGVEICSCLKIAQQYQAVQRGRSFQAEVGAEVQTQDILTLQKVWLQRYSQMSASQRNLSGSTFII